MIDGFLSDTSTLSLSNPLIRVTQDPSPLFNFSGSVFAVPREAEPEVVGPARRHDQRGGAVGGAGGAGRGARLPQGVVQLSG